MNFKVYLKKNTGKKIGFLILILIIITWSIFLYIYGPERIIEKIGINNAYLFCFLAALFGGTSIFFPFPYYLFVISFGAGGVNPFLLGLFSGLGLIIGDTTSYIVGYKGKDVLPEKGKKIFEKLRVLIDNPKYKKYVPGFLFLYGSISPLPNDIIVVPMGLAKYPYLKFMIPFGIGLIVFNTLLAFAGLYGLNLIF
jgi:membrane protein YqaA with SNARE-associated domain